MVHKAMYMTFIVRPKILSEKTYRFILKYFLESIQNDADLGHRLYTAHKREMLCSNAVHIQAPPLFRRV